MTIKRLENVGIVVEDLEAVVAFFLALGLELEGEGTVEDEFASRISGLDDVRLDVAMMRTPDGSGRLELMRFQNPPAVGTAENAPANTLGIRRVLFAVEDIEAVIARVRPHGGELVGELTPVAGSYLFCYVRGPEGIIVGLAEQVS
jgi:catechol 2,3-dioxygenase-like lactoylglutathione lyase family enzyme